MTVDVSCVCGAPARTIRAHQLAQAEEEARARYERTGSDDARRDAEFVAAFRAATEQRES